MTQDKNSEHLQLFMQDNYVWLTEWLTNVYVNKSLQRKTQVFFIELKKGVNILEAVKGLQYFIMQSLLVGKRQEIKHNKGNVFTFDGFYHSVGRMPQEGDTVILEARRWMEIAPIPKQVVITDSIGRENQSLGLVCDFAPTFIVQKTEKDSE